MLPLLPVAPICWGTAAGSIVLLVGVSTALGDYFRAVKDSDQHEQQQKLIQKLIQYHALQLNARVTHAKRKSLM